MSSFQKISMFLPIFTWSVLGFFLFFCPCGLMSRIWIFYRSTKMLPDIHGVEVPPRPSSLCRSSCLWTKARHAGWLQWGLNETLILISSLSPSSISCAQAGPFFTNMIKQEWAEPAEWVAPNWGGPKRRLFTCMSHTLLPPPQKNPSLSKGRSQWWRPSMKYFWSTNRE